MSSIFFQVVLRARFVLLIMIGVGVSLIKTALFDNEYPIIFYYCCAASRYFALGLEKILLVHGDFTDILSVVLECSAVFKKKEA